MPRLVKDDVIHAVVSLMGSIKSSAYSLDNIHALRSALLSSPSVSPTPAPTPAGVNRSKLPVGKNKSAPDAVTPDPVLD
jgi:hypothetical protein